MKQISKWTIILILVTVTTSNLRGQSNADVSALDAAGEVPMVVAHTIRQTTVQIRMIRIQLDEESRENNHHSTRQTVTLRRTTTIDKGIGTLLSHQGKTLLVSHDHWLHLTSTVVPDLVQFHDADGRFLLEMTGDAFSQLMLFHDGGTLIMHAPPGLTIQLSSAAPMGHVASLQPGDIVYVAHRQANQKDTVVLMAAEVLAIGFRNNIPLLSLRSLNGQTIEPGDSGGGVWLDGRFVGNLWMTVIEVNKSWWPLSQSEKTTTYSYAAGIGYDLLPLISLILEPQTLPTVQTMAHPERRSI